MASSRVGVVLLLVVASLGALPARGHEEAIPPVDRRATEIRTLDTAYTFIPGARPTIRKRPTESVPARSTGGADGSVPTCRMKTNRSASGAPSAMRNVPDLLLREVVARGGCLGGVGEEGLDIRATSGE